MKTILITGADGFLGVRAALVFQKAGWQVAAMGRKQLDITDADAVLQCIRAQSPAAVLHCAAISDTGQAQREPALSFAVNVCGTQNIARACAATGAKLVYLSSDQVYNGCETLAPLPETAVLSPEGVYAQHKLEAEQRVAAAAPDAVGLRLTWMYDVPQSALRLNRNLLVNLAAAQQSGTPLSFAVREQRGITDVWQVARSLPACCELAGGVYNLGSENTGSTYDTARAAAACMGVPETLVLPDAQRYPAHVRNLLMDTAKLRAFGICLPDTVPGLRLALGRGRALEEA